MVAVSCVALTNVVACGLPIQSTTELLMKPEPFTVSVNCPEPALTVFGVSEVITGTGFAALIVNVSGFDVVPDGAPIGRTARSTLKTIVGVNTVTDAVPTF